MDHRHPMGAQLEFDVRSGFYKDSKKFEFYEAQIVSDLGKKVKKEFEWAWDGVEEKSESVKLVFYGRKNRTVYHDDLSLGEVFDDCEGECDLDAIMIVSLAGKEDDVDDLYHQFLCSTTL
ncbi:hypothetical protein A2U01_0042673 [Trifolium medium]|uniref:Uncharacterized protein n=1 Tax=Trifolium medium TaxID=97028 RepID=A0A392QE05_9FABA|nr:hypothetical protein [Trifolium medium]